MSNLRKTLINQWLKANKPDGIRKLAEATGIPTGSLRQISRGRMIQDELKRASLARVLGVEESVLWSSPKDKSRAS